MYDLLLYQSSIMHAYKLLEFYYPVVCNLFGQNEMLGMILILVANRFWCDREYIS